MANEWYVEPAGDFSQGLQGLGIALKYAGEAKAEREETERKRVAEQEAQVALYDALQTNDPQKMFEAASKHPSITKQVVDLYGLKQDFQKQEASDFATEVLTNPQRAGEIAQRRAELLAGQGRDNKHTIGFLQAYQQDPQGAIKGLEMSLAAVNPEAYETYAKTKGGTSEAPAAFQALQLRADAAGLQEGTPEYEEFMRTGGNPARLGQASAVTRAYDNGTVLKVLPDGSTEVTLPDGSIATGQQRVDALRAAREEQVDFAGQKSSATAQATSEQGRLQKTIDEGLDAAQGAGVLRRAISLLDEVQTGGFNNAKIRAKQFFGVESADEGELAANLGKAVLSQLKATFGNAFTEKEGARLEGIEARLGANTETNKRLLQQTLSIVERAANRAIDAAYESGDERTARDIEDLLDFTLIDDGAEPEAPRAGQVGRFTVTPIGD